MSVLVYRSLETAGGISWRGGSGGAHLQRCRDMEDEEEELALWVMLVNQTFWIIKC